MTDTRKIVAFSCDGEMILGVEIKHYTNPLDDFYVIYADYALHKVINTSKDSTIIIDNVIIPACDEALADYRVHKQYLEDLEKYHKDIENLMKAYKDNSSLT